MLEKGKMNREYKNFKKKKNGEHCLTNGKSDRKYRQSNNRKKLPQTIKERKPGEYILRSKSQNEWQVRQSAMETRYDKQL